MSCKSDRERALYDAIVGDKQLYDNIKIKVKNFLSVNLGAKVQLKGDML